MIAAALVFGVVIGLAIGYVAGWGRRFAESERRAAAYRTLYESAIEGWLAASGVKRKDEQGEQVSRPNG